MQRGLAVVPAVGNVPEEQSDLLRRDEVADVLGPALQAAEGEAHHVVARDGRAAALDLVLSVVPSLVAWASLALPRPLDACALGLLLLAWGVVDQDLPRRGLAPAWFGRLRVILSGVAGLAMIAAALG